MPLLKDLAKGMDIPVDWEVLGEREWEFKGKKFKSLQLSEPSTVDTFTDEQVVRERWWDPKPFDTFFDIGAQFGSYTLPMCAHNMRVIAVEPKPECFAVLCLNLQLNGWYGTRCIPVNMAISSSFGELVEASYAPHSKDTRKFPCITLDYLSYMYGLPQWIKIDVEGHEVEVLKGGKNLLGGKDLKIQVECHQFIDSGIHKKVVEILEGYGFKVSSEPYHSVIHVFGVK